MALNVETPAGGYRRGASEIVLLDGERPEDSCTAPPAQHRANLYRAEAIGLVGSSEHAALALACHFARSL